jgi:hypothetical protein
MKKTGMEATRKVVVAGVLEKDRFEDGLRNIDMFAWTRGVVVALSRVSNSPR